MKTKLYLLALWLLPYASIHAEVIDAFDGYLPVDDASQTLSLNGEWKLKVVQGIDDVCAVPAVDDSWGKIPVPGCWEAYGFSKPQYDYPDSLTGYYRTSFILPREWKDHRIVIRMDGVLRGYNLFINDSLVDTWESSFNTRLIDITSYLSEAAFSSQKNKEGEAQQLSMRVYSRYKGYEFDCADDWAAMGIHRDVTLMAIPRTHLSDYRQETIEAENGQAKVRFYFKVAEVSSDYSITLKVKTPLGKTWIDRRLSLNADGEASIEVATDNAMLWNAETPHLYDVSFSLNHKRKAIQRFNKKLGIRKLTIQNDSKGQPNILCLNGRPIKLRGVNQHASDHQAVKVVDESLTLKDMKLMKEASINYLRLSHYPREPRFYELADSLGFYVIDEIPFSYGDKHLTSKSYYDVLRQRTQATVRRDINHACVIMWSIGNENPLPKSCIRLGEYLKTLDPSRDFCYPQKGSYFRNFNYKFPDVTRIYAPHYPTTSHIAGFHQRGERPTIFTEYCHTLGISFEDHDRQWEIIERTPSIAGGSVWEWNDQGMPLHLSDKADAATHLYGYEERVLFADNDEDNTALNYNRDRYPIADGFEMFGNKGTDGLVYANRIPLPNYFELQHNYAQIRIIDSVICRPIKGEKIRLNILNRYDFVDLKDHIDIHWTLQSGRDTLQSGQFSPQCPPRATAQHLLSLSIPDEIESRMLWLNFEIQDRQRRTLLRQSVPIINQGDAAQVHVDTLTTQESSALPSRLRSKELQWMVRAGRKPTMSERLRVDNLRIHRYLIPLSGDSAVSKEIKIQSQVRHDGDRITFSLLPDTTGNRFLSELGLAFLLPSSIDRVQWIGQGPYPSYPGRYRANRFGIWSLHKDDLYFEGNRMGVEALYMSDSIGNGYLLVCPPTKDALGQWHKANINLEQTDRGIVVTYNVAVSGQGPKFARTAFAVRAKDFYPSEGETQAKYSGIGEFYLYPVSAEKAPRMVKELFDTPASIKPFRPFKTQYDTYLMRFDDIISHQ